MDKWPHNKGIPGIKHAGVARALRLIHERWSAPISVKDLQAASGLSRRGFHKAFIEHIGCSPGSMLRCVRMEGAKGLLRNSDLKLKILARRCGYEKANSFCVAFRQYTGISAREFRGRFWLSLGVNIASK